MGDQLQAKLRKRLEALLKLPDNQVCCDCKRRGPRWASANLGVFMCIDCSGIHRNLGVHISFVRSVNLDTWTVKQVDFMESWGNNRAAQYFEAELPSNVVRPREGDSVRTTEKFIRDKYEHRKYCGREIPPPTEYDTQPVDEPTNRRRSKASSSSSTTRTINRPSSVTPAAAPVKTPAKEEPNLLDFMEDTPPTATNSTAGGFPGVSQGVPPQMASQQQQQFSPGFDQFQSAPAQPAQQQLPQDNGLLQPVAAAPPKASATDILSMFNQPPPNMYGQAPMGGMMGGQAPMGGMMGGQAPMGGMMNMGMTGAPGQPMKPPMNNMGQVQGFPPQQMQQHPPQNMNMQSGGPMQHNQQMGAGMGAPGQQRPPPQMNNPYGQQMMQQGMPPTPQQQQMGGGMPMQMGMGGPPGHPQQQMMHQNHMMQQPPQQQMQQMGRMMGMQQPMQMMQGGGGDQFPSQAPPPLPSHPPPSQDQGVFNFGSPNSLMSSGSR